MKMKLNEYRKMQQKRSRYGHKPVTVCPACLGRVPWTKKQMKQTGMVYHCEKGHSVIWKSVWTADSEAEYQAWLHFDALCDRITILNHHEKFKLTPDMWATNSHRKEFDGEEDFDDWYHNNIYRTQFKPKDITGWVHTPATYYESDFTFLENGQFKIVEVKERDRRSKMPKFINSLEHFRQTCKRMKMIGYPVPEVYEMPDGIWWYFNDKWQLVQRGGA